MNREDTKNAGWQPQKTKDDVKRAIAKYVRSILTPS
jgi:hypothetical protein